MIFSTFKQAVSKQFSHMAKQVLFRANISGDELWQTYLAAFPAGSNPIYRQRTEHDCSCCRQFIRNAGNVIAIVDGHIQTIWDVFMDDEPAYQAVADALSAKVRNAGIDNIFVHYDKAIGTDKNFEQLLDGSIATWNHFHINLPNTVVMRKDSIPSHLGTTRTAFEVMRRGLDTISFDAIDMVLELIGQNSLYRGEEFKNSLTQFRALSVKYQQCLPEQREAFLWVNRAPVGMIRNTVIGTLLVDLSEGMSLEDAVKSFEAKVAPANYKRPKAVVTARMIADAKTKVEELGLTSALQRRYAKLDDITINNVIYADRSVRSRLGGDVFDSMLEVLPVQANALKKVEEVTLDNFINNVLPAVKTLEVLVENHHAGNFMSLITAVDPTAPRLFKWGNPFSWSYTGDVTDSIKERVKAAGGSIVGDLCCRLSWHNADDLDFHMREADGNTIYFGVRRQVSSCGGTLDVDMNGCDRQDSVAPVENIFYKSKEKMKRGIYELFVHCYSKRDRSFDRQGFEVEVEALGKTYTINSPEQIHQGDKIKVATINFDGVNFIVEGIPDGVAPSREIWGIKTQTFVPTKAVMFSPNHWDDQAVGNKHVFFMLTGCANDGTARGFYNEFLDGRLDPHRKVMEMVGSKLKTENSEHQLSGLGFSTTQRASVVCRVTGSFSRMIRVIF